MITRKIGNSNFETFNNALNMTIDDLNIAVFDTRADFAIGSASNNKVFSVFPFTSRRWIMVIVTNNNTVDGASVNFIVSNSNDGIVDVEDLTHVIVTDQATGTFINTQTKPFLADRTFATRYHEGNNSMVIKGFVLGVAH